MKQLFLTFGSRHFFKFHWCYFQSIIFNIYYRNPINHRDKIIFYRKLLQKQVTIEEKLGKIVAEKGKAERTVNEILDGEVTM